MAESNVATVRFNFVYSERGRKAPDREPLLRAAWLAAFDAASSRRDGDRPVLAGGKSLGGRIASMCVADGMPAAGLVFLGYPLHAPGRPSADRAGHLERIDVPMLFVQGTRDALADLSLLEPVIDRLGERATLERVEGGDHSFKVPGPKVDPAHVGAALAGVVAPWVGAVAAGAR
jgi:predicted alpha/beta-hydrolase family hydrolase